MSYPLPRCEWEHCTGHLGKFQSCRDEALYSMSLDGGDDTTGETDFEGHYTLMILTHDEQEPVPYSEDPDAPKVTVPAGAYLVLVESSGAVFVGEGTEDELRVIFTDAAQRYAEWLGDDDEDEVTDVELVSQPGPIDTPAKHAAWHRVHGFPMRFYGVCGPCTRAVPLT